MTLKTIQVFLDGEPVAETQVYGEQAAAYLAALPQAYVPQEYPKHVVDSSGVTRVVADAEEEAEAMGEAHSRELPEGALKAPEAADEAAEDPKPARRRKKEA